MLKTPVYSYNMSLLEQTLEVAMSSASRYGFVVHYALKANSDKKLLERIHHHGFGVDCVSGNEVRCAIENGFSALDVVFAGVGKSDSEIRYAISQNIFCFNCESMQELEVIDSIACQMGVIVQVALRVNPDVDPQTHKFISTGKAHSKFGISHFELEQIVKTTYNNIDIIGVHFHIGSQITKFEVYEELCEKVNIVVEWFGRHGITFRHINLGGGLGIDYENPEENPIVDFDRYFSIFDKGIKRSADQKLHFELGRSLVGQCGALITRVLYNKVSGSGEQLVVVDAGMNDLMRPALYGAKHKIINLSSEGELQKYTIVGPICESSDIFSTDIFLPKTCRGDLLAIQSTGAYGASMASNYNMRKIADAQYLG